MQKLALTAVLTAFASTLAAQPVTIYGTINASVAERQVSGVRTTVQGNGDYLGSSVLGLRGTEDLGGGLKASFNLEGDLNVGDGTGDATGGGLTFDRQSWVEISSGVLAARVGRLQDIAKDAYNYGIAGANQFDLSGSAPFSTGLGLGGRHAQSTRVEATVAGFRVSGSYSNDVTGSAAGAGQGTQASTVGVEGQVGAVSAIAAYTKRDIATGYVVGGKFKLGTGEIAATFATHDNGAASSVKANTYQVGAVVPVGGGFNVRASVAKNNSDTATADADFWGVMLEKTFSKRTSAYMGYSDLDVNNGTTGDTKIASVGLQHRF